MKTKVIVGMSGGVDSSVAAYLLKQQGYDVEGLFMKNWEQDDDDDHCPAAIDLADAEAVCAQLNIPLHVVNFSKGYWDNVFEHFLHEYQHGRTPNPDVLCNKEIKFKLFYNYAKNLGADYIATGHYARVKHTDTGAELLKAKDRAKDQTYFLHAITEEALQHTLFPIGDYFKPEIREIAAKLQLATSEKKDSTGICFIGERRFKTFLSEFILAKPGVIKNTEGETLGTHQGLMYYTIGQRQGLQIGGIANKGQEPWYVADKDLEQNILYVVQGSNHPRLYKQGLMCAPIHWLGTPPSELPLTCYAKIRYRQEETPCLVSPLINQQHCIMFSKPERAITPGQYIVFYDKNRCLGGAVIESVID